MDAPAPPRRRWWAPAPDPALRRRRWRAPAPDPALPAVTVRRAYAEVVLVYLAFFLVGIIAAALLLGGHAKDVTNTGSWGVYLTAAVDQLCAIGLAVAVVLLLAARRGVTPAALGLRLPRLADGRLAVSRFVRLSGWCFVAIIVGNVFVALLQTGSLPSEHTGAPELIFSVFQAVQAGVIEELVVLAFLVVTLRQAGRPWWEVTVVALVLRAAYHIYYGPGVLGILVWAALFYLIYIRSRELVPLMICHGLWDSVAFLGRASTGVVVVAELGLVALWLAGVILWLIDRNNRPAASSVRATGAVHPAPHAQQGLPAPHPPPGLPAPHPPPGWHPDPAGHNRWRWWDGYRWTEHVSPP